jgi:ERCC4-type nuclease
MDLSSPFPEIPDFPVTSKKSFFQKKVKESNKKVKESNKKVQEKPKKFNIKIVLDIRERDLYTAIQKLDTHIQIDFQTMPIGDAAIYSYSNELSSEIVTGSNVNCEEIDVMQCPTKGKLMQMYERKSIADLLASILDGRYKEQCFRMLSSVELPPHNMVYLIEGHLPKQAEQKRRVLSAMTSIQYFKNMSLLRSWNIDETAEILISTAEKIEREMNESVSKTAAAAQAEESYAGGALSTNAIKNRNITPENIGEIILTTIPGISNITAHAIMQKFKTFPQMMQELLQENVGENLLNDIRIGTGVKSRKIGKNCVNNIRRFLLDYNSEQPSLPVTGNE